MDPIRTRRRIRRQRFIYRLNVIGLLFLTVINAFFIYYTYVYECNPIMLGAFIVYFLATFYILITLNKPNYYGIR